ncbi:hypothetical protein BB8028_0006g06280 [Beauveria bassiana]|uniref:PD-(D/E)XK nuclease-like domain-containing protein n=1 Tax=Beauveria bassiana TaxID=176275 RepID=A0A2S7YJF1_BEABA|nr:hypothetical protein BB8028_0006g06280 [Beauveria bassiana]
MASLRGLEVPVEFFTPAPGVAIPADIMELREALSAVEAKESLLPAVLRSHPDFQGNARVRRQTWLSDDDVETWSAAEGDAVLQNHERLRDIVDESRESAETHRSEAAWNSHVHSHLLKHVTRRHMQHLKFEDITSARIIEQTSAAAASLAASNTSGRGLTAASATSAHKMVNFTLVVHPSSVLQTLIDQFLKGEPWETQSINQTRYELLRTRPAPIFIETRTVSGTKENANVQLGI